MHNEAAMPTTSPIMPVVRITRTVPKATWVTLRGIEGAKQDAERLCKQSVKRMDSLVVRNEFLANLMLELMRREK